MAAAIRLVRRAGGDVMGAGVILTEGHSWRTALGDDAKFVTSLGHIPQFDIVNGTAVPDPATEKGAEASWLRRLQRASAPPRVAGVGEG
jgi:adenine phosphoribosyltransferase